MSPRSRRERSSGNSARYQRHFRDVIDAGREHLRSIVYGRDATPEVRAAAEEELRRLDAQEQAAASDHPDELLTESRNCGDGGEEKSWHIDTDIGSDSRADLSLESGAIEPLWHRRMTVGWLIPLVLGCLVVGAVGALGATGQLRAQPETPEPSTSPSAQASEGPISLQPPVGDLEAADKWFTIDAQPKDSFPHPDLLKATKIEPSDVRLLMKNNDDAVTVWAGRSGLGSVCLLVSAGSEIQAAASCSSREDFVRDGIAFGVNGVMVAWNGREVTFG